MANFPIAVGIIPKYAVAMEKTFSQALREHLARTKVKVTDIARSTGVNKDAIYSLKYEKSHNMNVDDAIKVARYFDMSVEEFMGIRPADVESHLAKLVASLSPREQAILEASLRVLLSDSQTEEWKGI